MYKTLSAVCVLVILLGGCSGKYTTKEDLLQERTQLLKAGDPGGAIALLKNALDRDQNFFEARLVLARAYSTAGKMDSAEKELQKLVRQRPNSPEVHGEMAKMHMGMSRRNDAAEVLKQTAALVADTPPVPYPLVPGYGNSIHAPVEENLRKSVGLGDFPEAAGVNPPVVKL